MVEPEQGVAGGREEVVVVARDEEVAGGVGELEEVRVEVVDACDCLG